MPRVWIIGDARCKKKDVEVGQKTKKNTSTKSGER